MKEMTIYTNEWSHPVYRVDLETGNITYGEFKYSGQWKFTGFSHTRRNEFISLELIKSRPEILDTMNWRFKNGKGQYTVRDVDHGTTREWGSRVLGVNIK